MPGRKSITSTVFPFILAILFIAPLITFSQVTVPSFRKNGRQLEIKFTEQEVNLESKEIISNVLRLKNNSPDPVRFIVNISHPGGWKSMNNNNRVYNLEAGDSIFIPVRVLPLSLTKGNTKYLINAFIIAEDETPLGGDFFFARTRTINNWELTVNPDKRVYFLNSEQVAYFDLNVHNTGNEQQNLLLSFNSLRRELLVMDTLDNIRGSKVSNLSLAPEEDTTLFYKVRFTNMEKNFRRVDIENHIPRTNDEERRMTMFVNTVEPKPSTEAPVRRGEKVDFVRLSNEKKVSNFAGSTIPLIAELNVNNMLSQTQPITNLILRGNTTLSNDAELVYFSQVDFFSNFFNNQILNQPTFYTGYFQERLTLEVGDMGAVAGGIAIGGGRGVRGSYFLTEQHRTGAYFFNNPRLFSGPPILNYGLSHDFFINNAHTSGATLGRIENSRLEEDLTFANFRHRYMINRNHMVNLSLSGSNKLDRNTGQVDNGYNIMGNYSNTLLNNRFTNQLAVNYSTPAFGFFNQERLFANYRSFFVLDEHTRITGVSNYQSFTTFDPSGPLLQRNFFNQVIFGKTTPLGVFSPLGFFNASNLLGTRLHYRGLGFMYSWYSYEKNIRIATNLRAGYNKLIDQDFPEFFATQAFFFSQYKTFTFNVRYLYGPNSIMDHWQIYERNRNPQSVFLSLQHQYLFGREHFVWQNNLNYSHFSHVKSHNIGYFPTIYYFSRTGWRFRFMMGYNLSLRNYRSMWRDLYGIQREDNDYSSTYTRGVNVGVGIRKEFGIPIPKAKQKNFTVSYVAFYDVNGNGIRDKNEGLLENVVIVVKDHEKFRQWEVITNEKGEARMLNLPLGVYGLSAFSLVHLEGWFPRVEPELMNDKDKVQYIPFVKGVKLYGNIFISREKMAVDSENDLDLSNIRISALDGKKFHTLTNSDGSFSFYLPYGKYTLSMDENVLGDRYTLVQNDFEMELDEETEGLFIPFYVVERRRKIIKKQFGQNGAVNSVETVQPDPEEGNQSTREEEERRRLEQEQQRQRQKEEAERQRQLQQDLERQKQELEQQRRQLEQERQQEEQRRREEENRRQQEGNNTNYDFGDMSAINELDSLIDLLLDRSGQKVNQDVVNQIEQATVGKTDLTPYLGKVSYAIQVGAYKSGELPANTLSTFLKAEQKIAAVKGNDGITRYIIGPFDTSAEAETAKAEIESKGIRGAFRVGVNNGDVIPAGDADRMKR